MPAPPAELLGDCFAHDRDRLSHADALGLIAERTPLVAATERIALADAAGRYAAALVRATRPVPAHDNAAVDGYALAAADLSDAAPTTLQVAMRLAAGTAAPGRLAGGAAARIFTGAPVPDGADTVVMQEDVETVAAGQVRVPTGVRAGANVRLAGEDARPGQTLVAAGQRLRPQDIAALASQGLAEAVVYRPLRVGVLSSGEEIARPGAAPGPAAVFDANRPMLLAMLAHLPVEAVDLGIVADDPAAVAATLERAGSSLDLVITSGGASRGEEDHLVRTVAARGRLDAWQIAVKPGRPLGLGSLGGAAVMMLPGNPVAVMVCFLLYGLPLLARLGGGRPVEPARFLLPAAFAMKRKKPDRREFLRGWTAMEGGALSVHRFPRDGSGLISSLCAATGLVELAEPVTRVTPGDMVAFVPFSGFGVGAG
jgi:molybdopterin molybdotransferase